MGAADVVPGVSGGTIALITGIYGRLIQSLKSADPECLKMLFRFQFADAWQRIDGSFLLTLIAGILTSVFTLAHGIDYLLDQHPILIWSVFFGIIFSSAISLLLKHGQLKSLPLIFLVSGVGLMMMISSSSFAQLDPSLPAVFLAGVIAISAMLLPGLSGSFLLLMLGLYEPTLEAVKAFDVAYLSSFTAGAIIGLLVFSRLIHWLLESFYVNTLMLLIGLLLGSLYEIWPWHLVQASSKVPVFPNTFVQQGRDAMLYPALGCMIFAMAFVLLLDYVTRRFSREDDQKH